MAKGHRTMLIGSCSCGEQLQKHQGHCLACGYHIGADSARTWHIKVRAPCPRCGKPW